MDVQPVSAISIFFAHFFTHFHNIYSFSRLIDMAIHFEGACYRTSYFRGENRSKTEILLPSARHLEERLTASQSVSQAVSWAGRQADRQAETHSLAFSSGKLHLQTVGQLLDMNKHWSSGKTLDQQPAGVGANPGRQPPASADGSIIFYPTMVQIRLSTNFCPPPPPP